MELQSISQIANQFNISTRTLRYYEQIGLINPVKTQGMTRIYNETAVLRLKQIIVLRKLRIPLKQIPDDMDVPAPLEKKRFDGGLYAAYMILMDEIAGIGWNRLFDGWLKDHELWESNMSPSGENMNGLLEEHLDILHWRDKGHLEQVDLLLPVKRKEK